jgi:hypothetical protein
VTTKISDEDLPTITKQKVSEKDMTILSKSIYWYGTFLSQIENI